MRGNTEAVNELPAGGDRESQWPKLAVKDFGPIVEGEVELRPLTVFAGPSNTGKSWMATLVYTIMRHVNGDCGEFSDFGPRLWFGQTDADRNELKNFPENPAAWLQSIREGGMLRLTNSEKQTLKSILESGQGALQEELLRCFGLTETHHLVCEGSAEGASVTFMSPASPDFFATCQRLTVTGEGAFSFGVDVMTDKYRPLYVKHFIRLLENLLDADVDNKPGRSDPLYPRADLLSSLVSNYPYLSTHYLPADRGGAMHAHRAMVTALIQNASRIGLPRQSFLPILSGVFGDFLEQLTELADHRFKDPSSGYPTARKLADSLEREILGGQIKINRARVDYPHFTYCPDGSDRDLSLMSVSSMVLELAPVALYLRHRIGKDDLLILEEPEAHLHPAMQVKLVREIAGWVKNGIRVLITTHSEWMVEAIANMVAADKIGKADGLPEENVGVWQFDMSGQGKASGSYIREVKWDPDEGGFSVGFDTVASELMNDWADLLEDAE